MKEHIVMGGKRGGKTFMHQLRLQTALQAGGKSRAMELLERFREKHPPVQVFDMNVEQARSHLSDAFLYGLGAQKTAFGGARALSEYKDAELVMEMLKRGFAVMPVPGNGPPDVLK